MKNRYSRSCLALLTVVFSLMPAHAALAASYTIVQLTDNEGCDDEFAEINASGQVTWAYCENEDVHLYDGTSILPLAITNEYYENSHQEISDSGQVVWTGYDGADEEIFLYDGTNIIQLTDNDTDESGPEINASGMVVWGSASRIMLYDGANTTQLNSSSSPGNWPKINDTGQVVWHGYDGTDFEIFFYDGESTVQLTNNDIADRYPLINNSGQVVWQGNYNPTATPGTPDSDDEIYFYDGTSIFRLTDNDKEDKGHRINNSGQVVWYSYDYGDPVTSEIFRYDHTPVPTTIQLTNNSLSDTRPDINDNGQVVWVQQRINSACPIPLPRPEIFLYDGTSTIQMTDNCDIDRQPRINASGQMVWNSGAIGEDTEIIIATPYIDEPSAGVVLLFDTSGSMSWRADGTLPAPEAEQRISLAKAAASPFLRMLNTYNAHRANFGIATFPAHPSGPYPFSCNAQVVTPMLRINNDSTYAAINNTIPGLTTEDNTPLLAGVETAAGMFVAVPQRAIVLLSDGYHNCPSHVSIGDSALTELIELLQANSIRVFTIGFGKPTDPDHELLEHLASETTPPSFSGSQFYDVTTPTFDPASWNPDLALHATYKDILVDALGLEAALDPLGVIAADETKSDEVQINEHEHKVSFYLSWRTPQKNRLSLIVRDASGNVVTAASTATGIELIEGDTYRILTVDQDYLNEPGKVGPSPWRIEIGSPGLESGETEPFQYSVIMDSDLKLQPGLERSSYAAGDTITLTAQLSEAGQPLTGLSDVQAIISAPEDGKGNWLSGHPVSAKELAQVPETKGSEHLMPFMRKAIYLSDISHIAFPSQLSPQTLSLYDDASHGDITADDGIYTNQFTDTDKEGVYAFRFQAQGPTQAGNGFERERQLQKYLTVQADNEATKIDATLLQMGDVKRYQVRATPKDTQGNFVGPGHTGVIRFEARGAKFVGKLQDNLDGSYAQTLHVPLNVDDEDVQLTVTVQQSSSRFSLADKLGKDFGYSLHIGRTNPTGNFGKLYDADINLGLDIEVPLQDRLSAVAALQYSNFKASQSGLSDTYWWSLSGSVKYQFSAQPLQPYIMGGAGLYSPESGSTEPGVLLGLGVDYQLNPQWSVELGADYHNVFTSGDNTEFWAIRAGLIFRP